MEIPDHPHRHPAHRIAHRAAGWRALLMPLLVAVAACGAQAADREAQPKLAPIAKGIAQFAKQHCLSCHDQDSLKGGFDLEDLLKDATIDHNLPGWHAVWERIAGRDMPPAKHKDRPSEAEYAKADTWLREQLETQERFAAAQRPRPMRRLNAQEYDRTIQQIFGLSGLTPAASFPPDDAYEGFTNICEAQNLSSVLVEQYLAAGEAVARLAVVEGEAPSSSTRVFATGHKEYHLTIRGHDPGGAMRKDWWIGDHLFVVFNAPVGTYAVRLKAIPRNLASRPGYIPHFQFRTADALVHQTDVAIRDGEPLVATFRFANHRTGELTLDFRWANGFPDNNHLRAVGLHGPKAVKGEQPVAPKPGERLDAHLTFNHVDIWELLRDWEKRQEKDQSLAYPFPYFEQLTLEIDGPLFPDGWPQSRLQRENAAAIQAQDAKPVAEWLLPQLYRRPATVQEIAGFAASVADARSRGTAGGSPAVSFTSALRQAIQQALVSPHFLFVVEPGPPGRALNDHELATRLALFLWGAPPDAGLMAAAAKGRLRADLVGQTRRLLSDERVAGFLDRFTSEWLGLARLATIMPEPSLYKRFDMPGLLRADLAAEPRAMMGYLLSDNRPLTELLDADYAFLNDRLADHYHLPSLWSVTPLERSGFTPVSGGALRKVTLPDDRRGGLVTMAGCLALTGENTRTSPVRRGVWILEKMFNRRPPPPPPNVNGMLPETTTTTTAVEQLKEHRTAANCRGCHQRIDPLGLALEHFDVIGEWRAQEPVWLDPASPIRNVDAIRKQFKLGQYDPLPTFPIDDRFEMDGVSGNGERALKQYLLEHRERFARGFCEKLVMYALGRRLLISDEPALQRLREAALKDGLRFQDLILRVVQSPLFQGR